MKSNLRLEVEQVGKVSLDITKFLKKKYGLINLVLILIVAKHLKILKDFFKLLGKVIEKLGHYKLKWAAISIHKLHKDN